MRILLKARDNKRRKDNFIPAPTAYAYTSHMYRAAYEGHLGDIIAQSYLAIGCIMKLANA